MRRSLLLLQLLRCCDCSGCFCAGCCRGWPGNHMLLLWQCPGMLLSELALLLHLHLHSRHPCQCSSHHCY